MTNSAKLRNRTTDTQPAVGKQKKESTKQIETQVERKNNTRPSKSAKTNTLTLHHTPEPQGQNATISNPYNHPTDNSQVQTPKDETENMQRTRNKEKLATTNQPRKLPTPAQTPNRQNNRRETNTVTQSHPNMDKMDQQDQERERTPQKFRQHTTPDPQHARPTLKGQKPRHSAARHKKQKSNQIQTQKITPAPNSTHKLSQRDRATPPYTKFLEESRTGTGTIKCNRRPTNHDSYSTRTQPSKQDNPDNSTDHHDKKIKGPKGKKKAGYTRNSNADQKKVETNRANHETEKITGCLDPGKFHFAQDDAGGQMDVRFPNGAKCTFGGYGASFIEQVEPSANRFCLRCCASANDQVNCNSHNDKAGCPVAVPGVYDFDGVSCS
ncbi:hypothetical protein BDR04DRAFT_1159429 [Suillus decipiens]|nr:hypothetical protein BDR04DRAFT_1159429 [Suillus decipiens]